MRRRKGWHPSCENFDVGQMRRSLKSVYNQPSCNRLFADLFFADALPWHLTFVIVGKESKMSSRVISPRLIRFVGVAALSIAPPLWASDLTATKTNNTGGTVVLGNSFDWVIQIRNQGTSAADLSGSDVLLRDKLPSTNISYGTPSVAGLPGMSCSVAADVLTCSAKWSWSMNPNETFSVSIEATPLATGTYVNPTGGGCAVDPYGVVSESSELNNSCSDTVTAVAANPDLTATKTNDTGGTVVLGASFDWKIQIRNEGTSPAYLSTGDILLRDTLPSKNIGYGAPSVAGLPGMSCSVWGATNVLTCSATSSWSIHPNESFTVILPATPMAIRTYVNPFDGECAVDPYGLVSESSELNNSCSDTVTCVGATALIFVDGFESGNVSVWSSSAP